MADLSRKYATWESEEDRRVLEWHKNGWNDYAIAKELRRSKNAIKRRLEEHILPQKSIQSYTTAYTPSYIAPQIQDVPLDGLMKQASVMYQKCINNGMNPEETTKYLLANRPMNSPIINAKKNDTCFIA